MTHHHYIEAISLLAFFGLDATKFSAGLDKVVAETKKKSPSIGSSLASGINGNPILKAIVSPIGAAAAVALALVTAVIAKVNELKERAKDIKIGVEKSNLTAQQYQPLLYAAQGSGADPEAISKGVLKIAEAQQKVKSGGEGSDKAAQAFAALGITLSDIKSKSYQELFLQIANAMHVVKLTGEQVAAGNDLMGKSFEGLEPLFKRGLDNTKDQLKQLTDEQLRNIKESSRAGEIFKTVWSAAMQNLANGALSLVHGPLNLLANGLQKLTGVGADNPLDENAKRLQAIVNARQSKKADKEAQSLVDSQKKVKNTEKFSTLEEEASTENERARLAGMSNGERLAELQKQTAELTAQRDLLVEQGKLQRDGANLPLIGKLDVDIAKKKADAANLQRNIASGKSKETDLTSNQKLGAFVNSTSVNSPNLATIQLSAIQSSEKHLGKIVDACQQLLAQAADNRARLGPTHFQ